MPVKEGPKTPDAPFGYFFCSMCCNHYAREKPLSVAKQEYKKMYRKDAEESQLYEVCDDCYGPVLKEMWFYHG